MSRNFGPAALTDMMNTTNLKDHVRRALLRLGAGSSFAFAVATNPNMSCSPRDAVVLVRDGIGDPCIPGDEKFATFGGYGVSEVTVDTNALSCKTGVCVVNHFQGRVTCPAGQTAEEIGAGRAACQVASDDGSVEPVTVPVAPQCDSRPADDSVLCTCSCAGDDPSLSYCACPNGFTCQPLLKPAANLGSVGTSYCIPTGSEWNGLACQ
jgi:hypothetical protein